MNIVKWLKKIKSFPYNKFENSNTDIAWMFSLIKLLWIKTKLIQKIFIFGVPIPIISHF